MTTTALDAATLEKLVSAAVAAPSVHNTQPWRFRLDPVTDTIEVHAAPERALRHTDPTGRSLHVSAGAAVFNLRVAAAHFGWEPIVRLLPRPAEPGLLASVRLAGAGPLLRGATEVYGTAPYRAAPDGAALYDAVWRRHSSRFPYTGRPVGADVRAEIAAAATAEGAVLVFPAPDEAARILGVTAEAERLAAADRDRSAESRAWVREGARDGIPPVALGPRDSADRLPMRDFTAGHGSHVQDPVPFEERPVLAVLGTVRDTRADWLRAGQGLERALLVATAHGVQASLFSQAVEDPDTDWPLRDPRGAAAHVQMLVRFGYGPEGPATPRRPVRDVLDMGV
jgi:nitroreductase